jgi:phage protein D/phage baseplate assembly protein gpV
MAEKAPLSTVITIKLEGEELQPDILAQVMEVIVDQHAHLPDMFSIRLKDPVLALLDKGPFDLTKKVEIQVGNAEDKETTLIKGEVVALEPQFGEGMVAELLVRGYDQSHRLYRERKSQAFLNKKDSDLAEVIAGAAGLTPEVEATNTIYDHVYQHNQSDLAFLMQRAWRIGYECFVDDNKLYFRKPPENSASVTLTWGDDLLSFRPRVTLAEQVEEVIVKGWDVDKQTAIIGRAEESSLYPQVEESGKAKDQAGKFGKSKLVIVDQPVVNQAEADVLAQAHLNERCGSFIQAEGMAFRRPEVKAGKMVTLESLGQRLSGKYLVTSATHLYNPDGFRTRFTVRGTRLGTLTEQIMQKPPLTRWPGVVTAVVTNTDDPNNWGRVKVKFPWMTEDAESDWARVAAPGAGPEAGFYAIPEVEDEVVVSFEHGDFSRPFILGSMWNGQHAVPLTAAGAGQNERPLVRTWHSRTGHALTMYDDADNKVELITAGGHTISVDDAGSKIEVKSSGGITIKLDDGGSKLTIEGSSEVEVKASANMKIEAGANMSVKASGNLSLEASGQVTIKGATVGIN